MAATNTDLRWSLGLASSHRCCLSSSSFCWKIPQVEILDQVATRVWSSRADFCELPDVVQMAFLLEVSRVPRTTALVRTSRSFFKSAHLRHFTIHPRFFNLEEAWKITRKICHGGGLSRCPVLVATCTNLEAFFPHSVFAFGFFRRSIESTQCVHRKGQHVPAELPASCRQLCRVFFFSSFLFSSFFSLIFSFFFHFSFFICFHFFSFFSFFFMFFLFLFLFFFFSFCWLRCCMTAQQGQPHEHTRRRFLARCWRRLSASTARPVLRRPWA